MNERKNKLYIFKIFLKCLNMISKNNKRFIGFTVLTNVILGVLPPISLLFMQDIIDKLQLSNTKLEDLIFAVVIYIFIDFSITIITNIYTYYSQKTILKFQNELNILVLEKSASLGLVQFENSEIYNMILRAQNEGNGKVMELFVQVISVLKVFVTIISYIIILFTFNMWIIPIVLALPVSRYLYTLKINKLQFDVQKERTSKERKVWYISYLMTMGNAFKEIKLFGLKKYLIDKYSNLSKEIINQDVSILRKSTFVQTILGSLDHIILGGVFFYIVYKGFVGYILIGAVITYIRSVSSIKTNIESGLTTMGIISKNALFIGLYFDFLELDITNEMHESKIDIDRIEKIELRNVSYSYGQKNVLKNINLTITNNNTVALIGKNGSGKTTLIKIIMGFYDNYEGEIFINDINLKKINKESLIKKIGCVFQDYVKYETTVRENVAYGNLAEMDNDLLLKEILTYSNFEDKVLDEEGLDTVLGHWFDNGKQLSMGEWQRIALSRGFIKKADLYILDEPNASLDAEMEKEILLKYKEILSDKIGIFITHNLNKISLLTEMIIVLDNGHICEQGNHEQLMEKKGIYCSLYDKQQF
ncbi:hypothetical protein AM499_08905 [Bacillus sp. FJAT-22090]|uniref:ABC transporter ATP-binding protein n=1 Tax=Bacillus sp. FJAT-22090 TaxID=1581038 RepID=UPI0006AF412B|nr:ABC transporter ATP-binding protein [Bacillus sp. FJAT-22090]ALC85930.1 hypothetical protein AM499_08905 [Bacillus sp. FJAT-22090]